MHPLSVRRRERGEHRRGPHPAGHQPDVRHPRGERGLQRRLLPATVRGHHDRGRTADVERLQAGLDREAERTAERHQGGGNGRGADDDQPGRRDDGLQEHLEAAAGQARVRDRDDALLLHLTRRAGGDAEQERLAADEHVQGEPAYGGLGAGAADEALDDPVAVHERGVAGMCAGRVQRPHHGRPDVRHPGATQLLGPADQAGVGGH